MSLSGATTRSLNDSNVRTLLGVPSGTISLSHGRGKSAASTNTFVMTPDSEPGDAWWGYVANVYSTTYGAGRGSINPDPFYIGGRRLLYFADADGNFELILEGTDSIWPFSYITIDAPGASVTDNLFYYPSLNYAYSDGINTHYYCGPQNVLITNYEGQLTNVTVHY